MPEAWLPLLLPPLWRGAVVVGEVPAQAEVVPRMSGVFRPYTMVGGLFTLDGRPYPVSGVPSKELERRHFWPDCFEPGCTKCLWWDICWALADVGIYVKGPEQW